MWKKKSPTSRTCLALVAVVLSVRESHAQDQERRDCNWRRQLEAEPNAEPPSLNVMEPDAVLGDTVAVNVTAWPTFDGLRSE